MHEYGQRPRTTEHTVSRRQHDVYLAYHETDKDQASYLHAILRKMGYITYRCVDDSIRAIRLMSACCVQSSPGYLCVLLCSMQGQIEATLTLMSLAVQHGGSDEGQTHTKWCCGCKTTARASSKAAGASRTEAERDLRKCDSEQLVCADRVQVTLSRLITGRLFVSFVHSCAAFEGTGTEGSSSLLVHSCAAFKDRRTGLRLNDQTTEMFVFQGTKKSGAKVAK